MVTCDLWPVASSFTFAQFTAHG